MKANELMIGDWIKFSETADWVGDLKGKPVQVEGLREEDDAIKIIDPRPDSEFRDLWSDDENYFEPIPLTKEILEKNGWLYQEYPDDEQFIWPLDSEIEMPFRLLVGMDGNRYWVTVGIDGLVCPINYIHELQHALRLCGVEKTIEL